MRQIDDRWHLRPLSESDAESIFEVLDSEREYMRVWLPFVDKSLVVDDTRRAIVGLMSGGDRQFAIFDREKLVGLIGFKGTDVDNKSAEIGYWLSQNAQGRGVMGRAVEQMMSMGFNEMGLNRVVIRVATGNLKSRRIPERLGFTMEGVEREAELLVDGVYADIALYSILKKEYKKNK